MAKKTRTWLRRTLLALLVLLLLGVVGFFTLGPGIIENSMNRMADTDLADPDPETVTLHDFLFIADLHSDTLMWNRDLLDRSDRGHMDLPRLQDGKIGRAHV